jgi:hypothetical protein
MKRWRLLACNVKTEDNGRLGGTPGSSKERQDRERQTRKVKRNRDVA